MSAYRRQALLDAPLESVWGLVATPSRYPSWWPRVIEVRGERFAEGDEYVQITRDPGRNVRSSFLIERRDDLREIRMSCQLSGTYAHWWLTPAQDGTFVELELGMEPLRLTDRVMDMTWGRLFFRRWSERSLEGLNDAVRREMEPAPAVGAG